MVDKQKKIKQISPGQVNWMLREFLSETGQLSGNPRGLLALWSCYMELLVNTVIKAKCKRGRYLTKEKIIPLQAKIDLLYELGIIKAAFYYDVGLLIKQRNEAVHEFDWNFNCGIIEKLRYLKDVTNKNRLNEINASATPWVSICFDLLSELGEHIKKMPPMRRQSPEAQHI